MKTVDEILIYLRSLANPVNVAGMARFGINPERALGISVSTLRALAREIRGEVKDRPARHALASELWASQVHEARILASIIDEPSLVSEKQMEAWAAEFDSWDLVDQCTGNLFDKTSIGYAKAIEWSSRPEEFVRRSGFALMAWIPIHARKMPDADFEPFFEAILDRADDERNFVKKAVNWALRNIGKRNPALRERAVAVARQMEAMESKTARWNARDALRELTGEKMIERVAKRGK